MSDPKTPDGVTVRRDVVHTRMEGYRPLSLDLYLPAADARTLCVYVHGGGWRLGSRREGPGPLSPTSGRLFGRMAAQGLAVASVDYRLSGEARYPAQPDDVRSACRWVTGEASPVQGLPLVLFGVSAGGLTAGRVGLDPDLPIRAVALWYPPTDLLALPDDLEAAGGTADRGTGSREALMLGRPASEIPDVARDAGPVAHVRAHAPPFLLMHGDSDVLVPPRQSRRLHEALLGAGAASTLELVPGYDHMFTGMPDGDVESLVDRTTAFLLAQAHAHAQANAHAHAHADPVA